MKIFILFSITLACGILVSNANSLPYEAIFNFGDSISDTGNAASLHKPPPGGDIGKNPYGSTYFKHPSGRMSDGRLIIDFIAEAYGLRFMPAYLNLTEGQNVKQGVNFAYVGATALDMEYFIRKGINSVTPDEKSLSVQLDWFEKLKPSFCKTKEECDNCFKRSLFLVGEIGGNDVIAHMVANKNIPQLREIVPLIVEAITNTTTALIEEGAVELVVPGNFPIGCNSAVLTVKKSDNKDDYDEFGCLKSCNTLAEYYNEQLKQAIKTLRKKNPQAKIKYFDYFNDAKRLFQAPHQYGFSADKNETFKACCGAGGPFNFLPNINCGEPRSTVCSEPSKRINWDGLHYTEAAYRQIAKGLLEGPFAYPPLKSPPFKIA
ncbi:GDSL esterase/lipase At5g45910-like [Gastrolobium bilobum]|uniref:GDSL esterase/lipase At5g45910-like n=1 Tax=Gastrolobium bilobum TaxID=150636 RepID=UPI002AB2826C|nr:GDSL esterase/lipase At5g45910-like [Gastrolobium bilobum]